ncbi:MAG: hypothetical protein WC648_05050 [Candidatus Paceibacterota bacterium]
MKKILEVILIMVFISPFLKASGAPTYLGDQTGLAVGTPTQAQNAGFTPGASKLFVGDSITKVGANIDSPTAISRVLASSNTTISSSYGLLVITSAIDSITIGATPSFSTSTATNYQRLRVFVASNTITIQDNDTLSGSQVELSSGTSISLTKGQWADFYFYGSSWYQDGYLGISGDNLILTGQLTTATLAVTGASTLTGAATLTGGAAINEDVAITLDASDEEFNLTTSSGGTTAAATLYNSTTDLQVDQHLLSLDLKDNGDANGIFLRCRDNTYADTVLKIGAQGAITIDADGAASGTVLSEATLVANDAAFRIDSETQDLQIGDGTNNTVVSDNGVITQTGSATATFGALSATSITQTGGTYGSVDAHGNTNFSLIIDSIMPNGCVLMLTPADGKSGDFRVQAGTHTAMGSFDATATVSLGLAGPAETGTDAGDGIAVYDGGAAIVYIRNRATNNLQVRVHYSFKN